MFSVSKSVQQVAALPFTLGEAGIEVMLVTARKRADGQKRKGHRWVLPKGWPLRREALATTAAREAHEEAGVLGPVHETPVGTYRYRKSMKRGYEVDSCVVVFALHVHEVQESWRERAQRERRWMPLDDAAETLDDRGAARLVAGLGDGAALQTILAELRVDVAARSA